MKDSVFPGDTMVFPNAGEWWGECYVFDHCVGERSDNFQVGVAPCPVEMFEKGELKKKADEAKKKSEVPVVRVAPVLAPGNAGFVIDARF